MLNAAVSLSQGSASTLVSLLHTPLHQRNAAKKAGLVVAQMNCFLRTANRLSSHNHILCAERHQEDSSYCY